MLRNLGIAFALASLGFSAAHTAVAETLPAQDKPQHTTVLAKTTEHFTLDGTATFLVGISYYGGLGASPETVRRDLDDLQQYGFNWIRVWVTWEAYGENVSALDAKGQGREPYLDRLQSLVAECDRRKMIVDVTLARSNPMRRQNESPHLPDLAAHRQAVRTLVEALKPYRNWYLDLANERDVGDDRFVPVDELKELRQLARQLQPELLVTASFGGHDLSPADIRDVLDGFDGDFLAIHRPRHAGTAEATAGQTREVRKQLRQLDRLIPVHHQEPFRRGYANWEPQADDFLTDLAGAIQGGAAGWCFHNGSTKTTTDGRPRRSFDLREQRLIEQLDEQEQQVLRGVREVLAKEKQR